MLTKGIITKLNSDNTIRVRIPLFESPGNFDLKMIDCTICYNPGILNGYKVNDVVWVGFEDNQINKPVILGKLYTGGEESSGFNYLDSLEVTNNAELPTNTKIGDLDYIQLKQLIEEVNQLREEVNILKKNATNEE